MAKSTSGRVTVAWLLAMPPPGSKCGYRESAIPPKLAPPEPRMSREEKCSLAITERMTRFEDHWWPSMLKREKGLGVSGPFPVIQPTDSNRKRWRWLPRLGAGSIGGV